MDAVSDLAGHPCVVSAAAVGEAQQCVFDVTAVSLGEF